MTDSPCSPCPHCPFPRRCVSPHGPTPCPILVIGEGPARLELRYGYPFAGDSGLELDDHYLPLAGLRRHQVRVTNSRLCAAPDFANPTREEAAACAFHHLGHELRLTRPQLVITLGAVASSLFGITRLDHSHGIPTQGQFEHWSGWVYPIFHPAQGIRVPTLITRIRADFQHLGAILPALLSDAYSLPSDPYPTPLYRRIRHSDDLLVALHPYPDDPDYLAIDTESDTVHGMAGAPPWCLTFSPRPGDGYLIRATDTALLSQFNRWLRERRPLVIPHNAPYDVPVCRQMGVEIPRWTDTLQMAYILQHIPQGLKQLALRLCGMAMDDFEDVVHPHARQVAVSYMTDIVGEISRTCRYSHTFKSGPRKGLAELRFRGNPSPDIRDSYNRATLLLADMAAGVVEDGTPVSPWKRWDGWTDEVREAMAALSGYPLPRPSIIHVPFAQALNYACADADGTGRIYPLLRALSRGREVRKEIAS